PVTQPPTEPPGPVPDPPVVQAGPLAMRRLTELQYRATVADVFGDDVTVAGRFEPDARTSNLLAVGASNVSVTPSGFEQYDAIARAVAAAALDPTHRASIVPCTPSGITDDTCAAQFVRAAGRRLWRRPLADDELAPWLAIARDAGAELNDFHAGLEVTLAALMLSPEFLFRVETAEYDPTRGNQRLTSLAMASRLSYFLWNTTPDEELLAAGERGELVDDAALAAQVDRLLASPRLEDGVRTFFADMYGFDAIDQGLVRKDPALFPAFSQALIRDAAEQTLRVIGEHLLAGDGDYRALFTTRHSFMTRTLGLVYRVPVLSADGWEAYDFPDDSQRAGVLTHVSLLALHSHPGRSSPTLRGKFVREVILCQDVPPPPGNIDFSMFASEENQKRSTARDRLQAHVSSPACAGCHTLMDPLGLALEKMDGIGIERTTENGQPIDPSGEVDGAAFDDAPGLGARLAEHPRLSPCLAESLFRYALGREPASGERDLLAWLQERFADSGYRLRPLLRHLVLSDAFRTTSGPREVATRAARAGRDAAPASAGVAGGAS
ncbi:DUF1592 domain-containing protein, partial [Candidatus Binatia bacterium]|nr:DUF1592 domain-containing protein [Candidatus Binatia bacterium]